MQEYLHFYNRITLCDFQKNLLFQLKLYILTLLSLTHITITVTVMAQSRTPSFQPMQFFQHPLTGVVSEIPMVLELDCAWGDDDVA